MTQWRRICPVLRQARRSLTSSSSSPSSLCRLLPPLSLSDLFSRSRWHDTPSFSSPHEVGPLTLREILFFTDRIVKHLRVNRELVSSLISRCPSSAPSLSPAPLSNMLQVLDSTISLLETSILTNALLHSDLSSSPSRHADVRKKVREVSTRLTVSGSFVDWLFSFCTSLRLLGAEEGEGVGPSPLLADADVHDLLSQHFAATMLCDHVADLLAKPPKMRELDEEGKGGGAVVGAIHFLPDAASDLLPVLKSAIDEVSYLSSVAFPDKYFDLLPELLPPPSSSSPALPIFVCPSFLRFAAVEILKNAVGSLAELGSEKAPPPVLSLHLPTVGTNSPLSFLISDRGLGLPRPFPSLSPLTFGAAPGKCPYDRLSHQVSYMPVRDPLKGIGAGLWLSSVCMDVCNGEKGGVRVGNRQDGERGAEAEVRILSVHHGTTPKAIPRLHTTS